MKALQQIQAELKAPKGKRNSFGNYNYRSCEDILEAVKPLLAKYGCTITLDDEVVFVGDRYYVKATATISNGTEAFSTHAFAREQSDKKGMDASQITGSTSSYARKYALNGLLAIDDTRDADTMDNRDNTANDLYRKLASLGVGIEKVAKNLGKKPNELTDNDLKFAIQKFEEHIMNKNIARMESTELCF